MSDYRKSKEGRHQSWFGLKAHVKRIASLRIPHALLRVASRRVPALRSGRLPAPKGLVEVEGTVAGASFVMMRPDRCEVAKELYWGSGKRPRPEDALALEIVVRLAADVDVFVDIGAYTGLFTLATVARNSHLRALAFEIVPAVVELLESNIRRNRLSERVVVYRGGVGVPGSTMTIPKGDTGSALPSFYSSRMHFEDGVEVGFRSLDSLLELIEATQRILLKIDVEGTESDIFNYGRQFLAAKKPDMLCELLFNKADPSVIHSILDPLGYRYYLVRGQDVCAMPYPSPNPQYRDWLLTLRSPADLKGFELTVIDAE